MSIFNTEHKRKSATITTILMAFLLFILFVFGMKYLDPPPESGIAVNFGTSNTGSGEVETQKNPKPVTSQKQEVVEEKVEETQPEEQTQPDTSASEEVVTQDSEETIAMKKAEEEKKRKADEDAKAKAEADRIAKAKAEAEAKRKAEEAKKKADIDALFKDANGNGTDDDGKGEGPDDGPGNKGNPNGDPYAASYYGEPGSGTGGTGGYGLNGRSKLSGGEVDKQDCNEAGRVVVQIRVNREGKVVEAIAGAKGTTNNAECLLKPAERAAYKYSWNKDSKAPTTQIGFIVINFKLGQ
ncbi:outer membrane transport energization protein TonB [Kordia periserrulae]|uniref:Outer membrane transport energization protein TonB n=1 Tax=Kordia periserrulae TaxID=701523 RepID=A0A2T6BXT5_9FLAO|nr:energy transducer TonB [Kordia periserrulae]PTX60875.1 outer membrane transport energization protein TonB [Kordia periserrulae]